MTHHKQEKTMTAENKKITSHIVIAAVDDIKGNGPTFYHCKTLSTDEEISNQDHIGEAIAAAEAAGYDVGDNPVVFEREGDTFDGPAWLYEHFDWETAPVVQTDGESD